MTLSQQSQLTPVQTPIARFFRESVGQWHSDRRYYTLPEGEIQEITSEIEVEFLEPGCEELRQLERLHNFSQEGSLVCGTKVIWESKDANTGKRKSRGSTLFGALGETLYRDRGFAISTPVTARFYMLGDRTLCLRTEYNGSVFEEEIKLIGDKYRTRQTVISRAGEQVMVGQYLEKRV